jgi:DNA-binding GntR family transcriptional regulator
VRRVYDTLRGEILTLELAPSTPLDETALSTRFALSRTPVREALVRLAADGLVVSLPNRGAIVAPLDLTRMHAYFDALALMQRATTVLAARHHRVDQLAPVEALQARFADAVRAGEVLAMIEVNRDFHVALARTGRNDYYTEFYARLLDEGRRMLRLYYASFDDRLPLAFVQEHVELLAAVRARDEACAEQLALAHARQVQRQVQSLFDGGLGAELSLTDAPRRA